MSLSENPPVKSWSLEFHSMVAGIKKSDSWELPIEQAQKQFVEAFKFEVPSNIITEQDVLDEKWKEPNDRLHGEWAQLKAIELLHLNMLSMLKLGFF
ncbi:27825_t:CDS:2, partial [Dentiscutata erythropus]